MHVRKNERQPRGAIPHREQFGSLGFLSVFDPDGDAREGLELVTVLGKHHKHAATGLLHSVDRVNEVVSPFGDVGDLRANERSPAPAFRVRVLFFDGFRPNQSVGVHVRGASHLARKFCTDAENFEHRNLHQPFDLALKRADFPDAPLFGVA